MRRASSTTPSTTSSSARWRWRTNDDEEQEEEAETGDESSGASDIDEPQRARRNRPTGLRYRICRRGADVTKDIIDLYIRKRREEFESLLVDQFGTKWQEFYKLGGTGEELEAAAAAKDGGGGRGGGAASGGIEAGPACNHVSPAGKEHHSTEYMPRWVLRSFFAMYPHVLNAMLNDLGHNMQLEENAKAVTMKHWREKAVKIFTDTASTNRAW
eukprot:jgi/Tetstr1/464630/TSEL_009384.t1